MQAFTAPCMLMMREDGAELWSFPIRSVAMRGADVTWHSVGLAQLQRKSARDLQNKNVVYGDFYPDETVRTLEHTGRLSNQAWSTLRSV
mgnify:CR=1 FL=1